MSVRYKKPDHATKWVLKWKDDIQRKETSFVLKFLLIFRKDLHVLRETFLMHLRTGEANVTSVIV